MAFIIFAAAWFALRYRQSNYEPPESTVTVSPPPPIVQPAQSGDQPASIAPAPAPEQPVAQAPLPPVPKEFPSSNMGGGEEIGGIGAFNTIAGETMYDFDPSSSSPPPPTETWPSQAPALL